MTKRTNKSLLIKGINTMAICLVSSFLGPTLLYIAFGNPEKSLYWPLIILGILICIAAITLGFKGLKHIGDSLFKS